MTGNVVAHSLNNGTLPEIVSDFKKMILKAYEQSLKIMCLVLKNFIYLLRVTRARKAKCSAHHVNTRARKAKCRQARTMSTPARKAKCTQARTMSTQIPTLYQRMCSSGGSVVAAALQNVGRVPLKRVPTA